MAIDEKYTDDSEEEVEFMTQYIVDPQGLYNVIKPIYYKGKLIDDQMIAKGVTIELDPAQADWLRREGCIE